MLPRYVLLDRDGVINTYQPGRYVNSPGDLKFIRGSLAAIRSLTEKGIGIVVISNQAGVGKGLMRRETLDDVTRKMLKTIEEKGGRIREVKYCCHEPDAGCRCRKPAPGMILEAARRHKFRPADVVFIGDSRTDIEAAGAAGCPSILVLSGQQKNPDFADWLVKPDAIERNLQAAVRMIFAGNWRPRRARSGRVRAKRTR